jgi:hypothetical protein
MNRVPFLAVCFFCLFIVVCTTTVAQSVGLVDKSEATIFGDGVSQNLRISLLGRWNFSPLCFGPRTGKTCLWGCGKAILGFLVSVGLCGVM